MEGNSLQKPDRATPLDRERIVRMAMVLADEGGLPSLSMRKLADRLGVHAMSIYHHVANKEELLDGVVDAVFSEIALPSSDLDWRTAMRRCALSAREVLLRHPWALGLLESRAHPGPATLAHHDSVLGCLRNAGFSVGMTAHAVSLLDSYIYGFALQEVNLPFDSQEELESVGRSIAEQMSGNYRYLAEQIAEHALKPGYSITREFEFGLEFILDGLEKLRDRRN